MIFYLDLNIINNQKYSNNTWSDKTRNLTIQRLTYFIHLYIVTRRYNQVFSGAVEVPTNDVSFESDDPPKALEDSPPERSLALNSISSSGPISEPSPLATPAPPPDSLPAHDPLVELTPVVVAENKLKEVPTANVTVDVINCKPSSSDVIEDFEVFAKCDQVVEHEEIAELEEVPEIEQLPEAMQSTATNSKMVMDISFEGSFHFMKYKP